MTTNIENRLEPARGYFDRVEYIDGNLIVEGWILVPDKRIDKTMLFIDKQFIREFDIVENEGVAEAFKFIPHASVVRLANCIDVHGGKIHSLAFSS